ncbi:type II toxin-antitoxin system RelE/ParE family toxin [Synechococcus sp. ATX 2A4]|uniref:type II toxin-antitoxin system RelE/ParE family toxin n=1 Tax=Synechococcus sp. ATX 2A4 TaxID=2823727 RepID=UPI0020CEFBF0|nr:type II toxin-antitoxin system RelE/ParE family toxin [Synechococcus sp. ATX 2A4]MCP9883729.1 type II toxin-antitoxin system RelE/ParE family toxin [Synechococcus sp. ATX 2A4]
MACGGATPQGHGRRAFYCFCSGRVITVLHAFVKKTQKTPRRELLIARERLRNVKRHG